MKEYLVELRSLVFFYFNFYRCKFERNYIAHHGIQRSGTNYLNQLLIHANIRVINAYDPSRTNPRHKHFRWQEDKSKIVLDTIYKNSSYASSIEQINRICGYSSKTKHIVIFRHPLNWLNGIYKWAIRSDWISGDATDDEINVFLRNALDEWIGYYQFWLDIRDKDRSSVAIFSHSGLINNEEKLFYLADFLGVDKSSFDNHIVNVPKSRQGISKMDPKIEPLSISILSQYGETNSVFFKLLSSLEKLQ